MITNHFDGVIVNAVVSSEVTGVEDVWFAGWDVSRLLGRRIKKYDMTRSGMVEGKDFAYVKVSDEVYFELLTPMERRMLRNWRKRQAEAEELGRNLRPNSPEAEKPGRKWGPSFFNGQQQRLLISEAGFYHLVFTSRGPFATQMKRWLADEVIPSIRKHGRYQIPDDHPIWEVFGEMESELQMFHKVVENAAEKLTVADIIGTNRKAA